MWRETDGETKAATDAAADSEEDAGCSWEDSFLICRGKLQVLDMISIRCGQQSERFVCENQKFETEKHKHAKTCS